MEYKDSLLASFDSYNNFREVYGYRKLTHNHSLKKFIDYLYANYPRCEEITQDIIDKWLHTQKSSHTNNTYSVIVSSIRKYLEYLSIIEFPTFLLDKSYSIKTTPYIPYLFSYEELLILFNSLDQVPPTKKSPNREYMVPLFFRTMYCCGMRPQEVVNLKVNDIDLCTGEMYIRNTKGGKNRHIYISKDLLILYNFYFQKIAYDNKEYVFEYPNNKRMRLSAFRDVFNNVLKESSLNPKIRPYDLRHGHITNILTEWLKEGENVQTLIPYLAEYVGHDDFSITYYYLHLIPDNIRKNASIDWDALSNIYPKVKENEI